MHQYIVYTSGRLAKLLHEPDRSLDVLEGRFTGGKAVTWLEQSPGMFAVQARTAEEAEFRVSQFCRENLVPEKTDFGVTVEDYAPTVIGSIRLE